MKFLVLLLLCIVNVSVNQKFRHIGINNKSSRVRTNSRVLKTTTLDNNTTDPTTSVEETPTTPAVANETCVPPSINDFPSDLFTNRQRRFGAIIFHILFAVYLFIAIIKLCDEYFINSLEVISERFNLDEDVAGATFMAAGSSAPEVFISLIGVFVSSTDVGIGTIVGSAVFNILFVIGICALFINSTAKLTIWPFFRDSIFYVISIIMLIVFIHDNKVYWYESLVMLAFYACYIAFMSQNEKLKAWAFKKFKILEQETHTIIPDSGKGRAVSTNGGGNSNKNYGLFSTNNDKSTPHQTSSGYARFDDDTEHDFYAWGGTCDSFPGLENSYQNQQPVYGLNRLEIKDCDYYDLIKNADEVIARKPRKIDFDTAVMYIMLDKTSFRVKTRFKMAARIVIDQIIWIKQNPNLENKTRQKPKHYFTKRSISQNFITDEYGSSFHMSHLLPRLPDMRDRADILRFIKSSVYLPLNTIFHFTIPDCKQENKRNWYMVTFLMSIVWLAVLSYFMIWMVTVIGFTLGIPDSIMGITFLAAGASIPDAYSSIAVVQQGYVDMGVSNIFGSNVFDILIGLAIPWFIKSWFNSGYISINSNGLVYDSILLFSCVGFTIAAIHFRKWHLDRRLGYIFLSVYAAFIIFSSSIELNLFAMVNPPTCSS